MYKEKPENVTNLTWVLGLIMFHITIQKMRLVLGQPLRNCLSLLLETPSEDDIETVAIQVFHKKHVKIDVSTVAFGNL